MSPNRMPHVVPLYDEAPCPFFLRGPSLFYFERATKQEKKWCQSELQIGKGVLKLPIAHGKTADFFALSSSCDGGLSCHYSAC